MSARLTCYKNSLSCEGTSLPSECLEVRYVGTSGRVLQLSLPVLYMTSNLVDLSNTTYYHDL